MERIAIARLPGWSRPTATERVFRSAGGHEVRLRDDSTDGFGYAAYRVIGPLPGTHYTVVARTGWESHDFLLVGAAGDTTAVEGWPVVSPDGRRAAVASLDFAPCFQSNSLEVWLLDAGPPVREFRRETGDCTETSGWGPSDVVWRDARQIDFTVNKPIKDSVEVYQKRRGRLTHTASGWTLSESP